MKLDLTGIHIEITEGIREFVERKVEKLEKFFDDSTICHVTISIEKDIQHVDIRIEYKGKTYIANKDCQDVYAGLEEVIEKIEGQARKTKTINEKKRREGLPEDVNQDLTLEEEAE
jgi:putative sigma-54 modulation protein